MELLTALIPIVIGASTAWLFDLFKKGLSFIDAQPAVVKQIAVAVLAFGLTKLAAFFGIQLSTTDIAGLTATDISTILSAGIAYLLHGNKQASEMKAKMGFVSFRLMATLAIVGITLACVQKVAAQPRAEVVLADLRVGAPCTGPATMSGCVISLYDSTANVSLASAVVVAKGDTLWRTRACEVNGTVVIGGTFVGTAPGKSPSAAVGARATGTCTAQAGSPNPVIIVSVTP